MNRRAFLRSSALTGVLLLAGTPFRLLAHASLSGSLPCIKRLYASMGTLIRFQVFHEDEQGAVLAIREAASLIQQIHHLMSVQETNSEIARWNRSATGLDEPLHPLTAGALEEAFHLSTVTGGCLDPTVGAAVVAYELGAPVAPQGERMGHWDGANRRLHKADPRVCLDLGGSAKGWAVDRAMEVLCRHGITSALINAGGDLRVLGAPPGTSAWAIGIRDPRAPDNLLGTLPLRDVAIATSGDYETDGSTLIDPRDLSRVRLGGSLSVVAPTCGLADGLATALCVEPNFALLPEGCAGLVARQAGDHFSVETTPGLKIESA